MVDFRDLGRETWDKTKVWRVEELWWWDEEREDWDGIYTGRTEFLTTKKMRQMIEAVKG